MKTEPKSTVVISVFLLTFLVTGGLATVAPIRIRPVVHIKTSLFEGDAPTEVCCIVVKSRISDDYVDQIWVYHIRNYSEAAGQYTTYYARDPFWDPEDEVWPHLGEYMMGKLWGQPDYDPPYLVYGYTPPIKYAYHVVVLGAPHYNVLPEDLFEEEDIAWGKTVNAVAQPKDWWNWTAGGGFEFYDQLPIVHPNFNNFPHPQGKTNRLGWPEYWPGDPDDHCHWDWCPRGDWPEELPEDEPYAHDYMTLEMVIDDWGTWDELWEEDVEDQGRWVQ
jgi:hypothetical protein